jgi:hypothetical protein
MPVAGQVYNLEIGAPIGVWSDPSKRHPGLIVSQAMTAGRDSPWVVVPLTGTEPRIWRASHLQLTETYGTLEPPMWLLCEYPTTVPANFFEQRYFRCGVHHKWLEAARNKLGWVLQILPRDSAPPSLPP